MSGPGATADREGVAAPLSPGRGAPTRDALRRGGVADRHLRWFLVLPAFAVVAATLLYPLAYALYLSVMEWDLSRSASPGPYVGSENYVRALTDDPEVWSSLGVTATFAALSVVFTLTIAMALALLLAGPDRLRVSARTLLVIPFAMSPALFGVSWRFLLNPEFGAASAVMSLGVCLMPLWMLTVRPSGSNRSTQRSVM